MTGNSYQSRLFGLKYKQDITWTSGSKFYDAILDQYALTTW